MRVFMASCRDNKYHKEMVASECSYNTAMEWLSDRLKAYGDREIYRTETHINGLVYIWTGRKRKVDGDWEHRQMFYYDENRGYLLTD